MPTATEEEAEERETRRKGGEKGGRRRFEIGSGYQGDSRGGLEAAKRAPTLSTKQGEL